MSLQLCPLYEMVLGAHLHHTSMISEMVLSRIMCIIFHTHQSTFMLSKKCILNTTTKESIMQALIFLLLVLVIFACAFGYMTYRQNAERRAREKRRNQYHDRV